MTPPSLPTTRGVETSTVPDVVAKPTLPAASAASTRTCTLAGVVRAGCQRYSLWVSSPSAIVVQGPSAWGAYDSRTLFGTSI